MNDEYVESEADLIEEEHELDDIKKMLEQKVLDLQGLSNLENEELKTKIISMKKVVDILYRKLKEADHKKNECENKLIKLQNSFNEQLEEDKKELLKLYAKSRRQKKDMDSSFYTINGEVNEINKKKGKSVDFSQKYINLLKNENKSLKHVAKDLKKKIKELKTKNSS